MIKLDGKFHGVIVKNKNRTIVPLDQWMVFLAKDNAVPAMLYTYYAESERLGASIDQLEAVAAMIVRVREWRKANTTLCKVADVQPGEITV